MGSKSFEALDGGPYSHNIISLSLREVAESFGTVQANALIDEFELEELGWSKEKNGSDL